jgi:hypothetical protein
MKLMSCLFALLLLSAGLSVAQTQSAFPSLGHAKLLSCDGLPCVDVVVGGKQLRLAIDSGDPNSVLDLKAAQGLGLRLQPVEGDDGKPIPDYQQAVATHLAIGGTMFKKIEFLVIDFTKSISAGTFPHVDGTLGYSDFKDRVVQLDYPANIFSLSEPLTASIECPDTCGDISLITFGHHGPPIVTTTGFTINGKSITVQVDTMFSKTLLIYPTSVDKLGLVSEARSKTSQYVPFTDDGVDMFQSTAKEVGFGSKTLATQTPLYFAGPKVHLPDGLFDGTVGAALLVTHKVSFDFHDNKFWLD